MKFLSRLANVFFVFCYTRDAAPLPSIAQHAKSKNSLPTLPCMCAGTFAGFTAVTSDGSEDKEEQG